jgi:hypothetical protein
MGSRCNYQHFRDLREWIAREFPGDKNLPRTVVTIAEYFLAFCDDCRVDDFDKVAATYGTDPYAMDGDMVRVLEEQTGFYPALENCRQSLAPDLAEAVNAKFGLGDVTYLSVAAFCAAKRISKREYGKRLQIALQDLRSCLERQIKERFQ